MISLQSCRINNLNWRLIHKEFQTFENCFPMRKQQREISNVFYGRQNGGCKILARLLSMMWCDDMRLGHYYRMLQSGPWGVSAPILLLSPRQKPAEQRDAGMLYWNLRCLPLKSNYNIHVAGLVINAMQIYCDKKTFSLKYPGCKRRTCRWGGFYGEQYLSDSTTQPTHHPTQPQEKK